MGGLVLKGVLIDLDGTLADSMPLLYQTYFDFLKRFGHVGSQAEFHTLIGPSLSAVVEHLNNKYHFGMPTGRLTQEYTASLLIHYADSIALFPGAREFLDQAKAKGLKLALVTSADQVLAETFLQAQGITNYFDHIITPAGLPESKPSPAIYLRALETLDLSPDETLAIEDSENGVKAAEGAGIRTVQFTGGNWHRLFSVI